MRLYNRNNERVYINAAERRRFLSEASYADPKVKCFCLMLLYTGCRISEALALRGIDIQAEARVVTFRTLKRKAPDVYREVPLSCELVEVISNTFCLDRARSSPLWADVDRVKAYRWIKRVMNTAGIEGVHACPRGLRHGYGVAAAMACVPITILQRWMGHASIRTTAIYTDVVGPEQLAIADRMWR